MVYTHKDIAHLDVMARLETALPAQVDIKKVLALNSIPAGNAESHFATTTEADLTTNILSLTTALKANGFEKYAAELEQTFIAYSVANTSRLSAKQADVHMYRVHDEDGEDMVDRAHPDGDVNMGDGDLGDVETEVSRHKKIVDVIKKQPTGKLAEYVNACKVALGQAAKGVQLQGLPVSDTAKPVEGVVPFTHGQTANYTFINGLLGQHLRNYTNAFAKLAEVNKLLAPFPVDEVPETTKQAVGRVLYILKNIINMSEESFTTVEKKAKAIEDAKMAVTKDPQASVIKIQDVTAAFAETAASKMNYQHATDFNDLNDRIGQADKQLHDMIVSLKPLFQSGNQAASKVNEMASNVIDEAAARLQ
jgi:hypothetical protein